MPKSQAVSSTTTPARAGNGRQASRPAVSVRPRRIDSVDLLRGLAMVLMALEHVRYYFTDVRFDPLDLTQTTPYLFFTRWITQYCAPIFVFLAGTSAFLYFYRGGRDKSDLAKFLFSRGLWLVFLELTLVRFAWLFNLDYSLVLGQLLWAIGWSMVALSALVYLPRPVLAVVSIGMIALHNLTDSLNPAALGPVGWVWQILHVPGQITWGDGNIFLLVYPLIPWIGVMGAGYLFGIILFEEEGVRRRKMYTLGFILLAGFIFLRALEIYGDPHPWSVQNPNGKTLLSFLNTTMSPPSLLYLMMTLGSALAILPFLEQREGKVARFITVFGRVPLFYYVLHLYLIHLLALIAARHDVGSFRFLVSNVPLEAYPPGYGYPLWAIYLFWIAVLFLLYLPCKWYGEAKRKSSNRLLSYF
jgi:uncharacterized membrane protein